jgi:hypothetical protein
VQLRAASYLKESLCLADVAVDLIVRANDFAVVQTVIADRNGNSRPQVLAKLDADLRNDRPPR